MTIQNEVTLETLEAMLTSMNQYIREEVATKEEVRERLAERLWRRCFPTDNSRTGSPPIREERRFPWMPKRKCASTRS